MLKNKFIFTLQRFANITNETSNTLVSGTFANDSISNYAADVTISGGGGYDTVYNSEDASNSSISGDEGNDSIHNYASQVTIDGGDGNDSVTNWGDNVTINGGAGNDSIMNNGGKVSINSGDDDDSISNYGSQVTIDGGTGNDSIMNNDSENVLFKYSSGDGNDTITGFNSTSTLQIGDGTDTYSMKRSVNDVLINVGEDVIKLKNVYSSNTNMLHINDKTIKLDLIELDLKPINLNDDNDSISNYDIFVKINGGSGNDSIYNNAKYVVINGGAGNDSIYNEKSEVSINGGVGDDSIYNSGNNNTLEGGTGNDTIKNEAQRNVSISGGTGNDSISSSSDNTTIDGGAGKDTVYSYSNNNTISGGAGADHVTIYGSNTKVTGGDGDDSIFSSGYNVTIDAGDGDDSISLDEYSRSLSSLIRYGNTLIKYTEGDGNDTIYGFNDTSTLSISGGSYSTQTSGNDVLINVGEDVIKLKNAYSTANMLHINDETIEFELKTITLTDSNDSLSNYRDNISIIGSSGDDTISNSGSNVLIDGDNGNDSISNERDNVTIEGGAGDDYVHSYNSYYSTINAGAGNDSISGGSVVYGGEGDDYISSGRVYGNGHVYGDEEDYHVDYHTSSGHVVYGEAGNDTITNLGSNSTILGGAGNDSIINQAKSGNVYDELYTRYYYYYGADNVSIDSGEGDDYIANKANEVTINGDEGNDTISNSGSDVSIDGDNGDDHIYNSGKKVTITGGIGDDFIENQGKKVTITGSTGNDTIRLNYSSSGKLIYNEGDGNDVIQGFNETSTLQIGDGTGTCSMQTSGNDVLINVGDGVIKLENVYATAKKIHINKETISLDEHKTFNLTDGDDYIANYRDFATIIGNAGNDTISNSGAKVSINGGEGNNFISNKSDNVTIEGGAGNDTISNSGVNHVLFQYTSGDGNDSIAGFNANSTLQIGDGTDTFSSIASGKNIIVTVGDGKITLQGAAKLSTVNIAGTEKIEENSWTLNNSTATYGTSNETLITIKGVKSLKGISLSGTTVTVSKASLNAKNVTVSDGYTLALADDVTKPTTKKAAWSLKSSTATYKGSSKTEGYTLASDGKSITYSKATSAETLVTVKGVKSLDGLKLSGTTVTVSKSSLNAKNVTISDGYTLKLGSDVTKSTLKNKAWSLKSSTATYKGTSTAGYSLEENEIIYSKKATKTLATLKGVKSTSGLKVSGTTITVSKASLNAKNVTVSDGYKLALSKDVTKSTAKKATWTLKSSTATYNQQTTAGYSLEDNSIIYSKSATTKTLATVKGAKSKSGISVNDNVITLKNSALSNKVTVSGSYEFDFASDYKKATITGSSSADTITARGSNIKLNGGSGADSLSGGSSNDSINGGSGNDVIFGNKGKDTLVGGNGNDSLWGGAGNDSLYGGAGNDTFIYKPGEGTDTIFDYSSGDLLQILKSDGKAGGTFSSSSFKSGNLTLSIDGGGSVIFNGISKSNSFNINGDSYKISGSKLVQK